MNKLTLFVSLILIILIVTFFFWISTGANEAEYKVYVVPVELIDQPANTDDIQPNQMKIVQDKQETISENKQETSDKAKPDDVTKYNYVESGRMVRIESLEMSDLGYQYAKVIAKIRSKGNVGHLSDEAIIDMLEGNPDLFDELSMDDKTRKIIDNYYKFKYSNYIEQFPFGFSRSKKIHDSFQFLLESNEAVVTTYISYEEQAFIDRMVSKGGINLKDITGEKKGGYFDEGYIVTEDFIYGDAIKYISFYFEQSPYPDYYLNVNSIKDKNLRKCVEEKLWGTNKNLAYLSCDDVIESFKGLEGAISIRSLSFNFEGNIDLAPILGYENLRELEVNQGGNINLRQIGSLKTLKSLKFSSVNVKYSESIKNLTLLTSLSIFAVKGFDFSVINELHNLKELAVNADDFSDIDFEKLTKLEELTIYSNLKENLNLTVLNQLSNLTKLTIDNANINNLPKLNDNNVRELKITHSHVQDFSNINDFKSLKMLILKRNNLSNIPDLSQLNNLEVIDVSENLISDISFLSNVDNLKMAYVYNNNLTDLSPIYNLPKLILLHAQGNQIKDISGIENLNQLLDVILVGNPIEDCYPATKLNNLIGKHWCEASQ
ncbi:leucine-rich repeat domain-containing protein [Marinicellulosiphila megalodicopiae]|uniref:leucine-rich repeat domain-containing protein n=1 Tax=Marinicellulosiphila megalodicopiae TaxID=2724896 RepID=UPI003BB134CB